MIEEGLFAHLSADAGVSSLAASRIFPLRVPQGQSIGDGAVVYQRVGSTRGHTTCATDRLVQGSFQIDAYAKTYIKAISLARALRVALIDHTGPMGDTHVDRVFLETEFDTDDPEPGLYRVSATYTIWYLEDEES